MECRTAEEFGGAVQFYLAASICDAHRSTTVLRSARIPGVTNADAGIRLPAALVIALAGSIAQSGAQRNVIVPYHQVYNREAGHQVFQPCVVRMSVRQHPGAARCLRHSFLPPLQSSLGANGIYPGPLSAGSASMPWITRWDSTRPTASTQPGRRSTSPQFHQAFRGPTSSCESLDLLVPRAQIFPRPRATAARTSQTIRLCEIRIMRP